MTLSPRERALVCELLRRHPDWSNIRIGEKAGCHHHSVRRIRRELTEAGAIPPARYVIGRDGRSYYRGDRWPGARVFLARLSDLRGLVNAADDGIWDDAPEEIRREFHIMARRLADACAPAPS